MFTPIDIQNHSLKTAVRGYNKKETDDFLEEILKSYEEIYKENRDLKDKVNSLSEGIQYYKDMEATLQKALVLAEKTKEETQEAAKNKAESVMSEAETKAETVMSEAETKAETVLSEAEAKAKTILSGAENKAATVLSEAETRAEDIQKKAVSESEALRRDAQSYADTEKAKADHQLKETREHVKMLVQSYENYRLQFKKLAESQIEMLESEHYSIFAPGLSEMLDDAPNAEEAMEEGAHTKNIHVIVEEEKTARDTMSEEPEIEVKVETSLEEKTKEIPEEPAEENTSETAETLEQKDIAREGKEEEKGSEKEEKSVEGTTSETTETETIKETKEAAETVSQNPQPKLDLKHLTGDDMPPMFTVTEPETNPDADETEPSKKAEESPFTFIDL